MDIFDKIQGSLEESKEIWREYPAYYLFEPWDVGERSKAVLDQAVADGIDLSAPDIMRAVGPAPHPFQTGYLLSTAFRRVVMANNQTGKTRACMMEILASATGEIPISLRYPKGHDTGVARVVNKWNIIRWGRVSKETGLVIDHDWRPRCDGSWDCGTVKGVGIFPADKIVAPGSVIRVGSLQRLILQNWWPAFTGIGRDKADNFIPEFFIDRERGSFVARGANKQDKQVFLKRGVTLQMLTYDAGKEGFEGIKVPTYLDEEPDDEAIIAAVVTHCTRWSLTMTPYHGVTYSKELAFPSERTPDADTFHATAYDCPYLTSQEIAIQRKELESKPWELGARLWGVPTEQAGKPYYDRAKINLWIQRFKMPYRLVKFLPAAQWQGIQTDEGLYKAPGLLETGVSMETVGREDQRAVWRLYEDVQEGVGYCGASDQADGAETTLEAGDWSTCMIGRSSDSDPSKPVLAASLRSSLPTPQFAREVLYAARYFNNALLCPESSRGAANASFEMVASDWPWWFHDVVTKWSTRKRAVQRGFVPTTDRRDAVFNTLLRDWMDGYDAEEYPDMPDEWVLREAAAAVVGHTAGGAARCDHVSAGSIDSLMAYGILLFVFKDHHRQVRCNVDVVESQQRVSWLELGRRQPTDEGAIYLGSGLEELR